MHKSLSEIYQEVDWFQKRGKRKQNWAEFVGNKELLKPSEGLVIDFKLSTECRSWNKLGEVGRSLINRYVKCEQSNYKK